MQCRALTCIGVQWCAFAFHCAKQRLISGCGVPFHISVCHLVSWHAKLYISSQARSLSCWTVVSNSIVKVHSHTEICGRCKVEKPGCIYKCITSSGIVETTLRPLYRAWPRFLKKRTKTKSVNLHNIPDVQVDINIRALFWLLPGHNWRARLW